MNQVYIFAGAREKMCSVGAIQGPELNISVLELKKKNRKKHQIGTISSLDTRKAGANDKSQRNMRALTVRMTSESLYSGGNAATLNFPCCGCVL